MVMIKKNKKGFTIIELLVAVAVFSFVAGSVSGIFIFSMRGQRKFISEQEIFNQSSYLMEYISRAVRMAKKDDMADCIDLGLNYEKTAQGIKFKNSQGICQEFYLENSQLKENKGGVISSLTSPRLTVLNFNMGPEDSWDQNDLLQPKISLFLEIEGNDQARIKLQTTISQRNLDTRNE